MHGRVGCIKNSLGDKFSNVVTNPLWLGEYNVTCMKIAYRNLINNPYVVYHIEDLINLHVIADVKFILQEVIEDSQLGI